MHSLASAATAGGAAAFAGQPKKLAPRRIPNDGNSVVAGRRLRRRSPLASAQPLSAQTYSSDVLRASAVQAPSGAVVPELANGEGEVPNVVALKPVTSANANVSAANASVDDQPPHAPLRTPTSPLINWLPKTRWPKGIPVVMGAHLLASHGVAPISVSKGSFFSLSLSLSSHPFLPWSSATKKKKEKKTRPRLPSLPSL